MAWNPPFVGAPSPYDAGSSGRIVYVATGDGNVYALAAATALASVDEESAYGSVTPLWRFRTGDGVDSSPVVVDGVAYIGFEDSYICALNQADGEMLWRHKTWARVTSTAAVVDSVVYAGSTDGYLYALDAASGDLIWRHRNEEDDGSYSYTPTVADSVVYVSSREGSIYAFRAHQVLAGREEPAPQEEPETPSAELLWRQKVEGAIVTPVTVQSDIVYVGSAEKQGLAFG